MFKKTIVLFVLFFMFLNLRLSLAENASNFSLMSLSGKTVALDDYKGKNEVILIFWTTWCPFCRDQLTELNGNYEMISAKGIEILAINVGESIEKVEKFVKSRELKYKVLIDAAGSAAGAYSVMGVPTYVIIDKKGQILEKTNSYPQKTIEKLIIK